MTKKLAHLCIASMIVLAVMLDASALGRRQLSCDKTTGKIINETSQSVILRGLGLGNWLLPEGYMWTMNSGTYYYDRPRRIEQGVLDVLGNDTVSAKAFWKLYHDNYVTEMEVAKMKSWGLNSLRVAFNANVLQPRSGQPAQAPYIYDDEGWRILDNFVNWCTKWGVWIIWDMHGAPGGQSADNICDGDGSPRLWTEQATYWPRAIDLWMQIVRRYANNDWVVGYNLLNEPLMNRYGIPRTLYRQFCIQLTDSIRKVDTKGILFIDGDDYAQKFNDLTPPWDNQIVYSFHCYPPVTWGLAWCGLDTIQSKYKTPVWHGETGEQDAPYTGNLNAVTALEGANPPIGWCWWTHKKFNATRQPWNCTMRPGFTTLINWWKSQGTTYNPNAAGKPSVENAKTWLMQQAAALVSDSCTFLPDMVKSLKLNPNAIVPVLPQEQKSKSVEKFKLGHSFTANGAMVFSFMLPQASSVSLSVFDISGKLQKVLVNKTLAAGKQTIGWNKTNESGKAVVEGVYVYKFSIDNKIQTSRQMVLVK